MTLHQRSHGESQGIDVLASPSRRGWEGTPPGDDGFTLVEVIITMVIIATVLLGLVGLQVKALTTTTEAKQRQQATAAGNLVMEQLRTLPYDKLSKGLHSVSLTGDPNITGGRLLPSSVNEVPIAANDAETNLPPLVLGADKRNLTTTTDTASNSVSFLSRAYVSRPFGAAIDTPFKLTVVTTWSSAATNNRVKTIVLRSDAFSPKGCLGTATRPFSGPCQAYLYGDAAVQGGLLGVAGASGSPLLAGRTETSISMALVTGSSNIAAEQTTSITGRAVSSGGVSNVSDVVSQRAGQVVSKTLAGDDPAKVSTAPVNSSSLLTQSAGSLVIDGTKAVLTATPSSADTGTLHSTAYAAGVLCKDIYGVAMAEQPCGSTAVAQSGAAGLVLDYKLMSTRDLPAFDLLSVAAAAGGGQAWSGRYVKTPGATQCASIAVAGCVASGATRSIGEAVAGKLPVASSGDTVSANVGNGLVRLTGYSDAVVSENGPSQLAIAPVPTRTGTLTYRNASGAYVTLPALTPATNGSYPLGTATGTYKAGTTSLTVEVSGILVVKPFSTTSTSSVGCATPCVKQATMPSVLVTLRYVVKDAGSLVSDLDVTLDLGALVSTTTYRAAPSA